jgi:hypothetical protein
MSWQSAAIEMSASDHGASLTRSPRMTEYYPSAKSLTRMGRKGKES